MSTPLRNDRIARFVEMTSVPRETATLEEIKQRMTCRIEGVEGPDGRPETLAQICTSWDVPYMRVMGWLMADEKRFAEYERALEMRAHALVAETLDIADGEQFPQEKRIRIETRFRLAQFHAPRMYAPKQEVTHELGQSFTDALLEISRRRALEAPVERGRVIEASSEQDDLGEI